MLQYIEGPSKEKRSHARDKFSAKMLYPVFTGREMAGITGAEVRAYIAQRREAGMSNATINRELGQFRAAINWAREELEWDIPNPALKRKLRELTGRTSWLTKAEALLRAAQQIARAPHLVDFIRLGLNTGMRSGEMLGLEWSRVDLKEGLIYVQAGNQKNGKVGSNPLNGEAREAILSRARFRAEHCSDCGWVFSDKAGKGIACIQKSFAAAVKKAGLSDLRSHDLRRTCGCWLVQGGVSIQAVSAPLRHSDIKITDQVYAHLAPTTIRNAVGLLDGDRVSRSGFTLHDSVRGGEKEDARSA